MCYILHVTDRQTDKQTEMEFETVFQMGNSVPQILKYVPNSTCQVVPFLAHF